jgi:hypothetical protein
LFRYNREQREQWRWSRTVLILFVLLVVIAIIGKLAAPMDNHLNGHGTNGIGNSEVAAAPLIPGAGPTML